MKHKTIYLLMLLAAISCGTDSETNTDINSTTIDLSSIEQTDEISNRILPHIKEAASSNNFSFPASVYNKIDQLLAKTVQIKSNGFEYRLVETFNPENTELIESLLNHSNDLEGDSQAMLHEYSEPLREFFIEIESSSSEDMFNEKIREVQIYLLSFRKLFPE